MLRLPTILVAKSACCKYVTVKASPLKLEVTAIPDAKSLDDLLRDLLSEIE